MPRERGQKVVASNRKARHDYTIEDTFEAGLVLTGTEVKSLRAGRASLVDGYGFIEAGEAWLSRSRPRVQTAQEFCDTALEGEFDSFDSRFHACSPSLQQVLEAHLERHQASFVSVT